jgi:hypothetical protein
MKLAEDLAACTIPFFPMSSKTRSIFQLLRACKAQARPSVKKGVKAEKAASAQASRKISGSVLGSVTGVDMRLNYLIFWMTKHTITMRKMKALSLSIQSIKLIKLVLLLLEW